MKKFELHTSKFDSGSIAIINNLTNDFASQRLKSMTKIKKEFRVHINNPDNLCFQFMTPEQVSKLESMLPNHRI